MDQSPKKVLEILFNEAMRRGNMQQMRDIGRKMRELEREESMAEEAYYDGLDKKFEQKFTYDKPKNPWAGAAGYQGPWYDTATGKRESKLEEWLRVNEPKSFHEHLKACKRCNDEPFNLCATGALMLKDCKKRELVA